MAKSNPPFMSGVPELFLLGFWTTVRCTAMSWSGRSRRSPGEAISLGEGVIYPVLHSLERTDR